MVATAVTGELNDSFPAVDANDTRTEKLKSGGRHVRAAAFSLNRRWRANQDHSQTKIWRFFSTLCEFVMSAKLRLDQHCLSMNRLE